MLPLPDSSALSGTRALCALWAAPDKTRNTFHSCWDYDFFMLRAGIISPFYVHFEAFGYWYAHPQPADRLCRELIALGKSAHANSQRSRRLTRLGAGAFAQFHTVDGASPAGIAHSGRNHQLLSRDGWTYAYPASDQYRRADDALQYRRGGYARDRRKTLWGGSRRDHFRR